jgi:hypothetical protein
MIQEKERIMGFAILWYETEVGGRGLAQYDTV